MVSEAKAQEIKERYAAQWLRLPGVWGVGVERDDQGEPVVAVHIDSEHDVRALLPSEVEGCPLKFIEDGPIVKRR